MTLLGNVLTARNSGGSSLENPQIPLSGQQLLDFLGVQQTTSGKAVNKVTALGLPAVWRAVQLSTAVPASLPFGAYKEDGTSRIAAGGQSKLIMDDPHPDMTRYEFWQTVYVHRRLWGNAYVRKLKNRLGQIVELWPIHPGRVKVGRESETGRKIYAIDGGREVFTDDEILHLPGMGYDGVCGVSPIRAARNSIGLGLATEEFGARLFANGALASGILQTEQRLTQTQADNLAKRWSAKRSGLEHAHETIVLDKGAKFTPLTIPPEDAQFLETRRFQVTEVCRWFGIPPFLMFETETSTSWGTGLEQQALAWVKFDLTPDLTSVEQRMTKHVLKPAPVYAKYSLEGLLRGDTAARAAFYEALWSMGALNANEIRAYEDMGPIDGGETYHVPLNIGTANQPTDDKQLQEAS